MKQTRKEVFILFLLFLISFVLKLYLQQFNIVINTDGPYVTNIADNLLNGKGFVSDYIRLAFIQHPIPHPEFYAPPILPIFLVLSFKLFGVGFFSAKLVSILFGSLLVFPVYYFAKELFNKKIAFISSLLTVVSVWINIYSISVSPEILFTFINFVAVFFFVKSMKYNKLTYYVLAGFFCGLAYLSRVQAIFILPLFIIAYSVTRQDYTFYKNKKIIVLFVIFLLTISPWLVRSYNLTGNPFYSEKSGTVTFNWNDKYDWINFAYSVDTKPKPLLEHIFTQPITFLFYGLKGIFRLIAYSPLLFEPLLLLFALWGIYNSFKNWKDFFFIYTLILFYYISFGIFYPLERYLFPLTPFFIIFSVFGVMKTKDYFKKINLKLSKNVIFILLIGVSSITLLIGSYIFYINESAEQKEAGLWLKQHTTPDVVVVSRNTQFAYYANSGWIPLILGDYNTLMNFSQQYDAKYIVFDERRAAKARPELAFLLDKENIPENLKLIYELNETKRNLNHEIFNINISLEYKPTKKVMIYEILFFNTTINAVNNPA